MQLGDFNETLVRQGFQPCSFKAEKFAQMMRGELSSCACIILRLGAPGVIAQENSGSPALSHKALAGFKFS